MVTIFGINIQLPASLRFLANKYGTFLITLAIWALLAFVVYIILFLLLKWYFRKTETEVDDVILGVSRVPFLLAVIIFGAANSLTILGVGGMLGIVERLLYSAFIVIVIYWVWKIFKEVAIYYGARYAEKTETSLDDILLPIVNQLGPIVIFILGLAIILQYWGFNLSVFFVAIGGAAFIVGLALQDTLSNVFSGISLVVDTPFRSGDLIIIGESENALTAEVKKIGLRVTELYNIANHSVIYMPNSMLANERIVNITKPSRDLVVSFTIGVGYESEIEEVMEILKDAIGGHPDVLGNLNLDDKPDAEYDKLKLLQKFESLRHKDDKKNAARKRLEQEKKVDILLTEIAQQLKGLVDKIRGTEEQAGLERGGLSAEEIEEIKRGFDPILKQIGLNVTETRDSRGRVRTVDVEETKGDEGSLICAVRKWRKAWTEDPDILSDDDKTINRETNQRIAALHKRAKDLRYKIARPEGVERRLDDMVERFATWLVEDFKSPTPPWKYPDANFTDFGESSLDFEVSVFIDDIQLEHFERQERVLREIKAEILRRFREAKIEIPFPQRDVWFRSELKWGEKTLATDLSEEKKE